MWWLNTELWVQLLDALAFLLVTPEFLKDKTLEYLRPKIVDRTEGKLWGAIFLIVYAAAGGTASVWVVRHFYATHASIGELFYNGISGVGELVGYYFLASFALIQCIYPIILLILALAAHVAYRRTMLIIGTILFFVARTLSGWNAIHRGG